jgi:hypothetical protein
MQEEIWKPIPGYAGYEASSEGRIRRVLVLKLSKERNGYQRVQLGRYGPKISVHRAVLFAFEGIDHAKPNCNHKNGVRDDNRFSNLEWMTTSENTLHKLHVLCRKHPRAKLTEEDAKSIRTKIQSGTKRRNLALRYNVSLSTIHAVASGQNWKQG